MQYPALCLICFQLLLFSHVNFVFHFICSVYELVIKILFACYGFFFSDRLYFINIIINMGFFMIYFMTLLPDYIRNMGGFLVIFPLYFSFVYFLRHTFSKCSCVHS